MTALFRRLCRSSLVGESEREAAPSGPTDLLPEMVVDSSDVLKAHHDLPAKHPSESSWVLARFFGVLCHRPRTALNFVPRSQ